MDGGDSLQGKTMIVTGASRGIGLAIAEAAAARGAKLVIVGRDAARLQAVANRIGAVAVAGSVEEGAVIEAACAAALAPSGRIDILINNAGGPPPDAPLAAMPMADFDQALALNLRSPLQWVRAVWRASMRRHGGSIVNMASIGGISQPRGMGAYAVAKAGLVHMTRMLAAELGPQIRVNAIAPGVVRTDATAAVDYAAYANMLPLGRVGEPADVAAATLFLASDAAGWITGQTLAVEGGTLVQTARWKRGWQESWEEDNTA